MRGILTKAFLFIMASPLLSVSLAIAECDITATSLTFGQYASNRIAPVTGTGSVTVICALETPYTVDLNGGGNYEAPNRRMNSGANYLVYDIYKDSGYSQIWGSTVAGGSTLSGTGTGGNQSFVLYGRIPGGQSIPAGEYSDLVTATITW